MADKKETLKPINTSFCDCEKLVTGGFVSVDKTAQIYELAKPTADGRRVVYGGGQDPIQLYQHESLV